MNSRIIIVVSGGCVRDVYSSNEDDEVDVIDYDNIADYDDDQHEKLVQIYKEYEKEIDELVSVY